MTLDPKTPLKQLFRDALRRPDGVVAVICGATPIILIVIQLAASDLIADWPIFTRVKEERLVLVFLPIVILAAYVWLNPRSSFWQWIKVVFIIWVGWGFMGKVLIG